MSGRPFTQIKYTPEQLREYWKSYFEGDLKAVRSRAITGEISRSPLRSVCWKLFFGTLPENISKWKTSLDAERAPYQKLRQKYVLDLQSKMNSEADLEVNNPLSQAEDSPWKRYFEDTELRKVIQQDVERTFPDEEFFRFEKVQNMLVDILFVYCRENDDVSYKQGMHELLAPILWVVQMDALKELPVESDPELQSINEALLHNLNPDYVEHDSFSIFNRLMMTCKIWFETGNSLSSASISAASLFKDGSDDSNHTTVVRKCHRVQNTLLKEFDPTLHAKLTSLGIEPQLYGIRWLRLLFGREFHMEDVLRLWDGIFADDPKLGIVEYIAVAMLIYIREQLLNADYTAALSRLMRFPPVENVLWLLERSIKIRDAPFNLKPVPINDPNMAPISVKSVQPVGAKGHHGLPTKGKQVAHSQQHKPSPVSRPTHQQQPSRSSASHPPSSSSASSTTANKTAGKPGIYFEASETEQVLREELEHVQKMNVQLAIQLQKGITILHKELLECEDSKPDEQKVYLALAGLKQVKDMLSGELPYEPAILEINETAFVQQLVGSDDNASNVDSSLDSEKGEKENSEGEKADSAKEEGSVHSVESQSAVATTVATTTSTSTTSTLSNETKDSTSAPAMKDPKEVAATLAALASENPSQPVDILEVDEEFDIGFGSNSSVTANKETSDKLKLLLS